MSTKVCFVTYAFRDLRFATESLEYGILMVEGVNRLLGMVVSVSQNNGTNQVVGVPSSKSAMTGVIEASEGKCEGAYGTLPARSEDVMWGTSPGKGVERQECMAWCRNGN